MNFKREQTLCVVIGIFYGQHKYLLDQGEWYFGENSTFYIQIFIFQKSYDVIFETLFEC